MNDYFACYLCLYISFFLLQRYKIYSKKDSICGFFTNFAPVFNYLYSKSLADSRNFNGILLIALFTLFTFTYVDAVVAPQMGWWQYYAWRMECGDVLYKDVYLFMPPYFVFFTKLLYGIFHDHVMLYTICIGLPVKLLCLLLVYILLCRATRPFYACVSVLLGGCFSATYQTDLLYDFNPITLLPCLLVAYTFLQYYERLKLGKSANTMAFLTGFLLAIIFCLKQTFGITFTFTIGIMSIVIYKKENLATFRQYLNHLSLAFMGVIVGLLPAVIYITVYDCWADFFSCMGSITQAKGGAKHIFLRLILPFDNHKVWVYLLIIVALWQLQYRLIKDHRLGCRPISIVKGNIGLLLIILALFVIIVFYANMPEDFHYTVSKDNTIHKWHVRFFYLLTYGGLTAWFIMAWRYFMNEKVDKNLLLFTSLIVSHFFTGILSTDFLEEIYLLIYIPWILAYALNTQCVYRPVKNAALLCIITFFLLTCISDKSASPYSWQGWREPGITRKNISSTVPGLEGISMPPQVNQDFNSIVTLILEHTTTDDQVLQFANIPLFNLLTKRATPGYAPITWFDVCPDELAIEVAKECFIHPPKMVVWHNMNKGNWKAVEDVFRGGQRSGQRELQRFYNEVICNDYELLYETYNHRDGMLELWVKK